MTQLTDRDTVVWNHVTLTEWYRLRD